MREGADERLLAQVGAESLSRLAGSCVGLVGAGTVGGSFSAHAAMLGMGQIIVDAGRIEAPNLGAQALPDASVGDDKARIRGWQAKLLNSDCRVEPLEARVEDLGLARLAGADLLVSPLDSRRSRLCVNEVSRRLEIPMLDLAVGNAEQGLLASVALYDPRGGERLLRVQDEHCGSRRGEPRGAPPWVCELEGRLAPGDAADAGVVVPRGDHRRLRDAVGDRGALRTRRGAVGADADREGASPEAAARHARGFAFVRPRSRLLSPAARG
jgi:molybdopterin/thiamine biosynthesis adenylyltransferase